MLRQVTIRPILLVMIFFLSGCSNSNNDAPRTDQAHPQRYLLSHSAETDNNLYSCQSCHGLDLSGSGNPVPGCLSCHESGPPFSIHPVPYTDPADHGLAAKADQVTGGLIVLGSIHTEMVALLEDRTAPLYNRVTAKRS